MFLIGWYTLTLSKIKDQSGTDLCTAYVIAVEGF